MQISGHWTVKEDSVLLVMRGEREQCSKCACWSWSGQKKIFQMLKITSASFVLPALSSKPRKWIFSCSIECCGWGWRRWSQNMADVCKQSDFYSWLLSASCLQQTRVSEEQAELLSRTCGSPLALHRWKKRGISFIPALSCFLFSNHVLACVFRVWGPGVHGMPPWLIACSLLCIVKHFGSCDGERHGVIVFSVPSLKMVKRSPNSCQHMVDRGVAWPENQKKLEYGFRFNVLIAW